MTARPTRSACLLFAAEGARPRHERRGPGGCWVPAVDVYRTPAGWIIKADLAGVRPEDTRISVEGRCVTIRGVRHDLAVVDLTCAGQECIVERMEIAYSTFERTVELAGDVGAATVRTTSRDGMLLLTIEPAAGSGG